MYEVTEGIYACGFAFAKTFKDAVRIAQEKASLYDVGYTFYISKGNLALAEVTRKGVKLREKTWLEWVKHPFRSY